MGEGLLDIVMDSIAEGVYAVDADGRITYWNRGAERITGYSREEAVGKKCSDNLLRHVDESGCELCLNGCPLAATLADGRPREVSAYLHHRDGHRVPVQVKAVPLASADGSARTSIEIFSDRSERSQLLSELEALRKESLTDALTGLGNRRYADLSLERALGRFAREGAPFGVLILDIDRFKRINDAYGHANGDRILRMVAWTLANSVRRMDSAARWGGEEFLVVAPMIDAAELARIAERARTLVERALIILDDGRRASVTVSIGGAIARADDSPEALVSRADARLYECKASGRNRVAIGG